MSGLDAFRLVRAFAIVDADISIEANLVLDNLSAELETDPVVIVSEQEGEDRLSIKLSDLRRLVLAVEKAAENHADPAGLPLVTVSRPAPAVDETADYVVMIVPADRAQMPRVVTQWAGAVVGQEKARLAAEINAGAYSSLEGRLRVLRSIDDATRDIGVSSVIGS